MKKKGFTLVELLVVIAIIAMLLAILMPALAKVRTLAQRIMCGTNVGGIGKAMLTYASDDKYESYPVAGPGGTTQDIVASGDNAECTFYWNCKDTPGTNNNQPSGPWRSTISACLYLLVKFADVPPEQFICPGGEEKKFELINYNTDEQTACKVTSLTEAWDFGSYDDKATNYARGYGHNSYSYQQPLPLSTTDPFTKPHPISATSSPTAIVLADRNPFWVDDTKSSEMSGNRGKIWDGAATPKALSKDNGYLWNSYQHKQDGQNVLYADQHVRFEKLFNVGVDKDNIYTTWNENLTEINTKTTDQKAEEKQVCGTNIPTLSLSDKGNFSQDDTDTYLVQDYMGKQ